jgi:leader peptidase (prepilin peptidase) / N-methyltransferase
VAAGVPESGGEHRLEGVQDPAGKPTRERGLVSRDLRAGNGEEKGNRLGVSARVPDRAVVRSLRVRRWGGSTVADPGSPALVGAVLPAVVLLSVLLVTALIEPAALPATVTVAALVPAAAIDVRERRLPDSWVLGAALTLVATTWAAWMLGQSFDAGSMLLGASVMAGPMLLLHLVSPGSMGFGDVKAGVVLGAALATLDWRLGLVALTLAAGIGAVVGAVRRSATIPFGPFLVLGATLAILGDDRWLAALSNGGG